MFDSVFILWAIAAVLGFMLWRRDPGRFTDAIRAAIQNLVAILPRLCVALILAGFVAKLLPTEKIGELIGHDTGWRGIALATLFGGLMPSGPMIAFPVVVVLRAADAGFAQIVAFLTAWSVFAWHRVLIYEVTMLGWHFAAVRMTSSLVLPFVAGGIALGLSALTGVR